MSKPKTPSGPQLAPQSYELVSIDSIHRHSENPRKGDVTAIAHSIQSNGFYGAVVIQKSTRNILAGNHRYDAAKSEGLKELPAIVLDVTDEQARRILLVDNRLNDSASYDDQALAEILTSIQAQAGTLDGTGYDQEAFDAIVKAAGDAVLAAGGSNGPASADEATQSQEAGNEAALSEDEPAPIDRADELCQSWKVERGQLWEIPSVSCPGKAHRILCGDSTDVADVDRLMQGEKAGLMATDPPYGVKLNLRTNHEAGNAARGDKGKLFREFTKIANDDLEGEALQEFLEAVFRAAIPVLDEHAAWYLWHAQMTQGFFAAAAAAAAAQLLVHRQIIWVKNRFVFGRGDYHWQHELCFYGWVKGSRPPFYGPRNQTSVWSIPGGGTEKDRNHPTQKPVELFAIPMRNHLKAGEIAYEPFSGSGSQLLAAEKESCLCRAMEIEPKYVAVALERMKTLGLNPRRAESAVPIAA